MRIAGQSQAEMQKPLRKTPGNSPFSPAALSLSGAAHAVPESPPDEAIAPEDFCAAYRDDCRMAAEALKSLDKLILP